MKSKIDIGKTVFSRLVLLLGVSGCATMPATDAPTDAPKTHALRLGPGRDVLRSLKSYASEHHLKAASIVSAVGSLTQVNLRYANQPNGVKQNGHFEITALSGVITESGAHVHMSIADEKCVTVGGHLLDENLIYTTLEIVMLEYPELEFTRELDAESGYKELVIKRR
jgi:uncharacterized protein